MAWDAGRGRVGYAWMIRACRRLCPWVSQFFDVSLLCRSNEFALIFSCGDCKMALSQPFFTSKQHIIETYGHRSTAPHETANQVNSHSTPMRSSSKHYASASSSSPHIPAPKSRSHQVTLYSSLTNRPMPSRFLTRHYLAAQVSVGAVPYPPSHIPRHHHQHWHRMSIALALAFASLQIFQLLVHVANTTAAGRMCPDHVPLATWQ